VHHGEVAGALLDEAVDQSARLADLGKPGDQHGRAIFDPGHRLSHERTLLSIIGAPPLPMFAHVI